VIINASTLCLWFGQGEGFTVEFFGLSWSCNFDQMGIWFGRPCSMETKVDDLDEALGTVSGDLTQTLNVLLEYYKTESYMYRQHASDLIHTGQYLNEHSHHRSQPSLPPWILHPNEQNEQGRTKPDSAYFDTNHHDDTLPSSSCRSFQFVFAPIQTRHLTPSNDNWPFP
jgi:hypothetical protein